MKASERGREKGITRGKAEEKDSIRRIEKEGNECIMHRWV